MFFQLRKLILWPRIEAAPRVLEFRPGDVNVISGASKTGKSVVIPIVDYCLGADKCTIPVGIIRENCSWFGILVDTIEGQKILARREPGEQQSTGDMVLIEGPNLEVPQRIERKTTNVDEVKDKLNRLAGLTNLDFEPGAEGTLRSHPSFRDLMAFTFQPQNIVANPNVLFFKADTTEHREKLKTIFPYILGAITGAVLQARYEVDRLSRILRRKEAALRDVVSATDVWRLEAQGWLRQGIELGLLPPHQVIPTDWPIIVDLLRGVVDSPARNARPSIAGIDVTLTRLEELRSDEEEMTRQLTEHRQRLNELRRLRESSDAYGGAMHIQRDRLALANWLRGIMQEESGDAITRLGKGDRERLLTQCENLGAVEVKVRSHPSVSDTLDRETLRQRAATEEALGRPNEIRTEISSLERNSEEANERANRFDRIERFLRRLEHALRLYDRADESSALRDEIGGLRAE
jgi:hypothetical protein